MTNHGRFTNHERFTSELKEFRLIIKKLIKYNIDRKKKLI